MGVGSGVGSDVGSGVSSGVGSGVGSGVSSGVDSDVGACVPLITGSGGEELAFSSSFVVSTGGNSRDSPWGVEEKTGCRVLSEVPPQPTQKKASSNTRTIKAALFICFPRRCRIPTPHFYLFVCRLSIHRKRSTFRIFFRSDKMLRVVQKDLLPLFIELIE